jgi:hypothetical protein
MIFALLLRIIERLIGLVRNVVIEATRAVNSQAVGCLGVTSAGAVAVAVFVVKIWPLVSPLPLPDLVRTLTPTFGLPPAQFLSPRIPEDDQRRLLALFYDIAANRFWANLDSRAQVSTGQWLLDLLPSFDKPEIIPPDRRPVDNRGFVSGGSSSPILKYRPPGDYPSPNEGYDDPHVAVDLAEMRYILRKYTQAIIETAPPQTSTEIFDEADLQIKRMNAIARGDMVEYNRLLEAHRRLYREHNINPCTSGFFPQGCAK